MAQDRKEDPLFATALLIIHDQYWEALETYESEVRQVAEGYVFVPVDDLAYSDYIPAFVEYARYSDAEDLKSLFRHKVAT